MVRGNSASSQDPTGSLVLSNKLKSMHFMSAGESGESIDPSTKEALDRQMHANMLKNKNLNRQKILLSPGAGNLRGTRVENNDRSVDEFDSSI
jgi:hypothetical protein